MKYVCFQKFSISTGYVRLITVDLFTIWVDVNGNHLILAYK